MCPGLRLAVIFTVKSICSRQKQHLILLWVAVAATAADFWPYPLALQTAEAPPPPPPAYHHFVSVIWPLWVFPWKVLHKNKQHTQKLAMKQRYKFMVISTTGAPTLRYGYTHIHAGRDTHSYNWFVSLLTMHTYAWAEGDHKRLTCISRSKKLELSSVILSVCQFTNQPVAQSIIAHIDTVSTHILLSKKDPNQSVDGRWAAELGFQIVWKRIVINSDVDSPSCYVGKLRTGLMVQMR